MSESEDMIERVAHAIFEAQRDFRVLDDEEPLPERHFKVAIMLYLAMASNAIAAVRQMDAGK